MKLLLGPLSELHIGYRLITDKNQSSLIRDSYKSQGTPSAVPPPIGQIVINLINRISLTTKNKMKESEVMGLLKGKYVNYLNRYCDSLIYFDYFSSIKKMS